MTEDQGPIRVAYCQRSSKAFLPSLPWSIPRQRSWEEAGKGGRRGQEGQSPPLLDRGSRLRDEGGLEPIRVALRHRMFGKVVDQAPCIDLGWVGEIAGDEGEHGRLLSYGAAPQVTASYDTRLGKGQAIRGDFLKGPWHTFGAWPCGMAWVDGMGREGARTVKGKERARTSHDPCQGRMPAPLPFLQGVP